MSVQDGAVMGRKLVKPTVCVCVEVCGSVWKWLAEDLTLFPGLDTIQVFAY